MVTKAYKEDFIKMIKGKSTESLENIQIGIDEGFELDVITAELLRRHEGRKSIGHLKVQNPISVEKKIG